MEKGLTLSPLGPPMAEMGSPFPLLNVMWEIIPGDNSLVDLSFSVGGKAFHVKGRL